MKTVNLISKFQAPLGAHLLRVEIYSREEGIEQMTEADFDAFLELVQFVKAQHKRATTPPTQSEQPTPTA